MVNVVSVFIIPSPTITEYGRVCLADGLRNELILQTAGQKVDHQAAAYVAPKKAPLTESNSNSLDNGGDVVDNGGVVTNGNGNGPSHGPAAIVKRVAPSSTANAAAARPRWGGAEICPRCGKSVRSKKSELPP